MKKYIKLTLIFVIGFVAGALVMDYLTIPARKVYREYLQRSYLNNQQAMASTALRDGKRLVALVHLWNDLDVDPLDGSKLFDRRDTSAFEDGFGFFLLPSLKAYTKKLVYLKPSGEDKVKALSHGKLAEVLQLLGYETEAKEHWSEAEELLNIPEGQVRSMFTDLIKKAEEGKQ